MTLAVDCDDAGKDFSDKLSQEGFPVLLDLPNNEFGKEKNRLERYSSRKEIRFTIDDRDCKRDIENQPVRQTSQCLEL